MSEEIESEIGPCMASLSERRQRFVWAMLARPHASHADWAREAGYSDVKDAAKVRAHYILQDPKVQAAAVEVSRATLGTVGPIIAVQGLLKVAANPKHPQHVRALEAIANRVGLHETQQIEVTHRDLTGAALIERIGLLADRLGIDRAKLVGADVTPMREVKQIEAKPEE